MSADVQISAISFREMQISWEFSNEDCYGPTFFNLTYVSAHGEIEFQLYNSSNFPNCPLYNATLKEIVRITNLTSGTKYQFFLTPYTDKGTEANPMVLGAETLAEPVEETGKSERKRDRNSSSLTKMIQFIQLQSSIGTRLFCRSSVVSLSSVQQF